MSPSADLSAKELRYANKPALAVYILVSQLHTISHLPQRCQKGSHAPPSRDHHKQDEAVVRGPFDTEVGRQKVEAMITVGFHACGFYALSVNCRFPPVANCLR